MNQEILVSRDGEVQVVRLNRPEKKNALTRAMYDSVTDALKAAETDDGIAVTMITGTGGVFCAGNDISDFAKRATELAGPRGASNLIHTLPTLEKPVVAAVDGLAIGVGVTMLFHCDLVYASPRASFRTPFLDLGLVMEAGSSWLAPTIMGHQRAFELLCLGEPYDAEAGYRAGFVNKVVPVEQLEAEALKAAQRLAAKPRTALIAAKRLMKTGVKERAHEQMGRESVLFGELLQSAEAREAFAAFLEKRKPDFAKARGKK
ncbi:MAG: crotonase/enoyl-CoA hydratase family protein [Proteobacteria bacterium]|nr:crotonase/enoyl-CoA hydratase family protein [Pseudomonadota bacterium]